ncbi:MAG: U32 family peptidase [Ideonella sp.]|nr:U32 family peptidase [Ideonella sp.]MCC7458555.1 U32 family peptidase [Nitrospira sp.]
MSRSAPGTLELLAPARDAAIGIEAVNHGADAVYIGGPAFGARDKAPNAIADLARLAAHAHRFHARVYITLNTILRDDELEAARRQAWALYEAGVDALIVQDMGLLEIDLPPIQLHASTQCDTRTPEKARFLQDVGFSKIILARELSLQQIRDVRAQVERATLEFFVHGALCVAYSGQCFISHAHTGRSANRGSCSQECRLPYTVTDVEGRVVAHEKHVLSIKDNDQSANLAALVDAGVRSFKIEGRYKDLGYVKNVTAHYRRLIDALLEGRGDLRAASSGRTTLLFEPDPQRNFNRGASDYFVNGRSDDLGAFDSPKHAGLPLGHVARVAASHLEVALDDATAAIANGDGLTWYDLQHNLQGLQVNTATALGGRTWRVEPNEPVASLKGLRAGTALHRNRDVAWDRLLAKKSAERRIGVALTLLDTAAGFALELRDVDGIAARAELAHAHQGARDAAQAEAAVREHLGRLGGTPFAATRIDLQWQQPWFVPASVLNALRRDAVAALEAARAAALPRLPRAAAVDPPAPHPGDALSYLANVYNHKAHDFYLRHGVRIVEAAYESHQALGDVSLMITKHCVRWSLSLCPKQAKGVTGVQGTIRAEPLTMVSGGDTLTLRFDCKPCEMHVVGRIKRHVLNEAKAQPVTFYRARPAAPSLS